ARIDLVMFVQQPHLFRCSLPYRVDVQFPVGLPQSASELVVVLPVDRLRQRASVIGSASFACHGATVTTVPLEGWRRASTSTVGRCATAGRPALRLFSYPIASPLPQFIGSAACRV